MSNLLGTVLCNDLESRYKILCREFEHLFQVAKYFETNNSNNKTKLRSAITDLIPIFDSVGVKIKSLEKNIGLIKDRGPSLKTPQQRVAFFNDYIKANYWITWSINLMAFLEKKTSYILECFPAYYPTPNLSRSRQEIGTYILMKKYLNSYLSILKDLIYDDESSKRIKRLSHSYWEFTDVNEIVLDTIGSNPNNKTNNSSFLLFKGSYYIVNSPSLWPLLLHEVLHFFLNEYSENKHYENKLKSSLLETFYKLYCLFTETYGLYPKNRDWNQASIKTLFEDCWIDSVCLQLTGLPYYIACIRSLFAFDELPQTVSHIEMENRFHDQIAITPGFRLWGARLFSMEGAFSFLPKKHQAIATELNESIKEIYRDRKYLVPPSLVQEFYDFYDFEICMGKNIALCSKKFLKHSNMISNSQAKVDFFKNTNVIHNVLSERFYSKPVSDLKEGRIIALAARNNFHKIPKSNDLNRGEFTPEKAASDIYPETSVFLIDYFKFRLDGISKENRRIVELTATQCDDIPVFLHLGSHNLVSIDIDYSAKGNIASRFTDKLSTLQKPLPYYQEQHACSALYLITNTTVTWLQGRDANREQKLSDFFLKSNTASIVIVQLVFGEEGEKLTDPDEVAVNFILETIKNSNELCDQALCCFNFGWPNYTLFFKVENNVAEFTKAVKGCLLKQPHIERSKTDILIGPNARDSLILPQISILLRQVGSKGILGLENLMSEEDYASNWEMSYRPGIYDVEISQKTSFQINFKQFKKLLQDLYILEGLSDIQFRPKLLVSQAEC